MRIGIKAELLPYQISQGMRVLQTYNQWWKDEIRPRVFTMIEQDNIRVRLLNPVKLV